MNPSRKTIIIAKALFWAAALGPFVNLAWRGLNQARGIEPDLGANPLELITLTTGDWTLRFLLLTLAISPLRKITRQNWLIRFRRLVGLFAFFYGSCHLLTYLWFDKAFDWGEIVRDIPKRPFITAGFLAWSTMLPLAATSTAWAIRKMGGKNWNRLHTLIYVSGIAGVVHYWWKVKPGVKDPYKWIWMLAVLLAFRIGVWGMARLKRDVSAQT